MSRILLVEDDPGNIDVMMQELEVLGHDVALARDGLEALEEVRRDPPDLIVMDILMPKMNGLEAARELRKDPKTRSIPILAATAKGAPGDKDACLEAGCDDYISKPFTYKQLGAAIERLLQKRAR